MNSQIANPQITSFTEGPLIYELFKSAILQICDLQNLFADRPPSRKSLWHFIQLKKLRCNRDPYLLSLFCLIFGREGNKTKQNDDLDIFLFFILLLFWLSIESFVTQWPLTTLLFWFPFVVWALFLGRQYNIDKHSYKRRQASFSFCEPAFLCMPTWYKKSELNF